MHNFQFFVDFVPGNNFLDDFWARKSSQEECCWRERGNLFNQCCLLYATCLMMEQHHVLPDIKIEACVCLREKERERESEDVYVCLREKGEWKESLCVLKSGGRKKMCAFETEREREMAVRFRLGTLLKKLQSAGQIKIDFVQILNFDVIFN